MDGEQRKIQYCANASQFCVFSCRWLQGLPPRCFMHMRTKRYAYTFSAHTPSVKPHFHGMCTQYRCTGSGYIALPNQYDLEGVFHTPFYTSWSIHWSSFVGSRWATLGPNSSKSFYPAPKNQNPWPASLPPPNQQTGARKKRRTYRLTTGN